MCDMQSRQKDLHEQASAVDVLLSFPFLRQNLRLSAEDWASTAP